jgi:nucleoid DNA-binding protein
VIAIIKAPPTSGEEIIIYGLGKFSVRDKNKPRWRNPQTGEDLLIDSHRLVVFRTSGTLRKNQHRWIVLYPKENILSANVFFSFLFLG